MDSIKPRLNLLISTKVVNLRNILYPLKKRIYIREKNKNINLSCHPLKTKIDPFRKLSNSIAIDKHTVSITNAYFFE
tara:strand:+ start:23 stop:253 length:231 start_codon:yes stop_codon:yes gene_type:complete